uniref:Uncharacterized protein n=1 Tax=Lepeophtheirus salmonis TaxID=72036 RepID=A0A0K2UYJ1_LEPSM
MSITNSIRLQQLTRKLIMDPRKHFEAISGRVRVHRDLYTPLTYSRR